MKAYWQIDSGALHGRSHASNWADAFIDLVRRKKPRALGRLVRARYVCCSLRDHGSHFILHYFDPRPQLERAGAGQTTGAPPMTLLCRTCQKRPRLSYSTLCRTCRRESQRRPAAKPRLKFGVQREPR